MNIRKITTDIFKVTCQGLTTKGLLVFFVLGAFFQAIFCHQVMGDRYVAESGSDIGNNCSDPGAPCATVRYAIYVATNQAETIHIANGIYREPGIVLRNEMTLVGNGAASSIIQASSVPGMVTSRVVSVSAGITGTLSRLTFRYGYATNNGGGLWNAGQLTLSECRVMDCESEGYGGGIENQGDLILSNSVITGCTSGKDGGGLINTASGIVMVAQCAFSNNLAQDDGGGIENLGQMTILDTTIAQNRAVDKGGGLRNSYILIASNTAVCRNRATSQAGGIYNINQMQLFQCTISSNSLQGVNGSPDHHSAFSAFGGGIYNNGNETLVNCSIEHNQAQGGSGYRSDSSGGHGKGGGLPVNRPVQFILYGSKKTLGDSGRYIVVNRACVDVGNLLIKFALTESYFTNTLKLFFKIFVPKDRSVVFKALVVHDIGFDGVFLDNTRCPFAKLHSTLGVYFVSNIVALPRQPFLRPFGKR